MAETARDQIATLLAAEHPGSSEPRLLRTLNRIVDDARDQGLDDGEIEAQLRSWAVQYPRRSHNWTGADAALADLRTLLVGPRSGGARIWDRLRGIAAWVFDHYIAVAGLATVTAAGFYGLAYARFYEVLDITPEQVGLSPTQIVTRSVLGGAVATLFVSTLVFAVILPLIPVRVGSGARHERGSWKGLAGNLIVLCASASVFVLVEVLMGDFSLIGALSATALPGLLLLGVSFRIKRIGGKRSLHLRPLRFGVDKFFTVYIAFALPVSFLLTGALMITTAHEYGESVTEGEAVRGVKAFGILPTLDVRAEPALVSWKKGEPAGAGIPRCVFYLGGANGDDVFYDHRSHSTFHVPAADVTIELQSDMWSC